MLKDIIANPSKYRKFYVAVVGAVISLLTIYFGTALWLPVLINFLTAVGVFTATNDPSPKA